MCILKNKRQITNLDIIEPAKAAKGGHIDLLRNICFVHNDAILGLTNLMYKHYGDF